MYVNTEIQNKIDEKVLDIRAELFSIVPGLDRAKPVPILSAETLNEKTFIDEWVAKNRPCLIKGAVAHWPAVEKWKDKAHVLSLCDKSKITAYPHRNYNDRKKQEDGEVTLPLTEAVERLFSKEDEVFSIPSKLVEASGDYAGFFKEMTGFSFLNSDRSPRFYPKDRIFMYRRAATAWHYHDVDETLMCQVVGDKTVLVLPPTIPQVAHVADFLTSERQLEGEILDPAIELQPFWVDVREGDALYIPPYWLHAVIPADDQIGFTVAHCWSSPWHILGDLSNYFVRKLYKQAVYPINKYSVLAPLLGGYALVRLLWRQLRLNLFHQPSKASS